MSNLRAVLTGTLMAGFTVSAILPEAAASARATELTQAGKPGVTLVPVSEPKKLTIGGEVDPDGEFLVVLGSLGTGFELVGPFASEDDADVYGDACTGDLERHSVYDVIGMGLAGLSLSLS